MSSTTSTEPPSLEASGRQISLRSLIIEFLKIGAIGFGGGMAIIALMEHELVERRSIIEPEQFAHGVGLSQILGPPSFNAALFAGYQLYGTFGGLTCGLAFMVPSIVFVLILSWLYSSYHSIPALHAAVAGLAPCVIALILSAAWSVGRRTLRTWLAALLCAAATAAGVLKISPVYVLVVAGALGLALGTRISGAHDSGPPAGLDSDQSAKHAGVKHAFLPMSLPATVAGISLLKVGVTFFTVGLVFFGGAFVLIPILHQTLVVKLGWLTPQEFVDGVAISQITPGPISVLATFAGYQLHGIAGALVATAALYLPAVIVMLVLCREYEHLRHGEKAQAFVAGVLPAVVGLILSTAILLGAGTLHSWRAGAVTALALFLVTRWKLHPAIVLALGALAGTAGILP